MDQLQQFSLFHIFVFIVLFALKSEKASQIFVELCANTNIQHSVVFASLEAEKIETMKF